MINYQEVYDEIRNTAHYKAGIKYGKPRKGHQEGTIQAHIKELEENLRTLTVLGKIPTQEYAWKLKILIHTHDTFKAEAKKDSAINDPESHASLARMFLSQHCVDQDLLSIVQYHDLGYSVYKKFKATGRVDEMKLMSGLQHIKDKNLFLLFVIIDSCTKSKGREGITWFIQQVNRLYPKVTITVSDILPGGDPNLF